VKVLGFFKHLPASLG